MQVEEGEPGDEAICLYILTVQKVMLMHVDVGHFGRDGFRSNSWTWCPQEILA